jgi:hypothetical protein
MDNQRGEHSNSMQSYITLPLRDVLLFQSVCIFSNLFAVLECIALLQVVDGEQFIVFMAMVTHSKVNGGAICSSCMHHLRHYPGYIQILLLFDITGGLVLLILLL